MDALDGVESLSVAGRLRQVAERGEQVAQLVAEVKLNEWALDGLDEIGWALYDLTRQERAVSAVTNLVFVADHLEELASAMRTLRQHRHELEDALETEEEK